MATKTRSDDEQPDIREWIATRPVGERSDLRKTLTPLCKMFKSGEARDLMWWHDVGVLITRLIGDGNGEYGSDVMSSLATELGANDDSEVTNIRNTLYRARSVAKTLTRREAISWSKKRNAKKRPLSGYHVFVVSALKDKDQQTELLKKCLTEGWSATRLQAEVQNQFGRKRGHGGRKPIPREKVSPMVGLQEIQLRTRHWLADHKVWFGNKKASLQKVAKKAQTEELAAELRKTTAALGEMQKALTEAKKCLKQLTSDVESKLKRKG